MTIHVENQQELQANLEATKVVELTRQLKRGLVC